MISASTKEIIDFSFNSFKLMEAHSRLPIRLIFFNASKNRLDAATFGGTLNYKHDEPTSFLFFIFMFLSCSPAGDFLVGPPQLGGGVAATELELEIRKDIA